MATSKIEIARQDRAEGRFKTGAVSGMQGAAG